MDIATGALSPDAWSEEVTAFSNAAVDPTLLELLLYETRDIRPVPDRFFISDHCFALVVAPSAL